MKQFTIEQNEVHITAENLEEANLNEWERLELHLLDQAAVVIPGKMTIMEVVRVSESLQEFATELLTAVGKACELCNLCNMEKPCDLMNGEIQPLVKVPAQAMEEAGIASDSKLTYTAMPEHGEIRITEAEYRYDLTDLPPSLLDAFRESGICISDLEEKLIQERIVYGADQTVS